MRGLDGIDLSWVQTTSLENELNDLIDKMKEPYRSVLQLYLDGYSSHEIKDSVHVSFSTISKAFRMLNEMWNDS